MTGTGDNSNFTTGKAGELLQITSMETHHPWVYHDTQVWLKPAFDALHVFNKQEADFLKQENPYGSVQTVEHQIRKIPQNHQ